MIDWKNLTCDCQRCKERKELMDQAIKKVKKNIDKKMDSLVKADVKRDKKIEKCDSKMMMKKKK